MQQEKVEIVRGIYERLNRGDVEGVIELCDDDFHMDMSERVFNPDTYEGHDGIRRFYDGVRSAWESYLWHVEEARVAGVSVVAMLHCEGQSREGGPAVDWNVAWLWRLRGRRAVSVRFYRNRTDALEAAGLAEESMSQENMEIVRAMAEAFNTGDWEGVLRCIAPDIEYHELAGMPGAGESVGVYRGHDELVRWYTEFLSQWEPGFTSEQASVDAVDEEHVITSETWRGRGVASAVPVEMTAVGLHTVRGGKIIRMRYFRTEAEALEAAALTD